MVKYNEAKSVLSLLALVALTTALPQPAHVEKVVTSGLPDNPPSIDLPFLQFNNGGIRVNFAGYHAELPFLQFNNGGIRVNFAGYHAELPFLQFKNGGIHVNFAGYHAEAGLGGLLGGSNAKGGLYASAGTPWGPSASAGLGGALGGNDGRASGGLHARAGLGNGGPEAAAGLGGSLDGSGRSGSRARGGLYAGATAGGPQAAAGLGGSIDATGEKAGSSYAVASDGLKTKVAVKEVSNIQSIAPPAGGEKVYLEKSGSEKPLTTLEFKLPAGVGKKIVTQSLATREVASPGPKYDVVGPNGVAHASDVQDYSEVSYPLRRYYRKRLRGSPVRKHTFYKYFTTNTGPVGQVPAASDSSNNAGGIVERQAIDNRPSGYVDVPYGVVTKTKGTTLFDDIFNIPISTLAAVNQLLNNKSG